MERVKTAGAADRGWITRHWGKAAPACDGPAWHPLACHALDVAAVGHAYLRRHSRLAAWLTVEGGWPSTTALLKWITFWLVLHDVGKFSLSFQCQRPDLVVALKGRNPPHYGDPTIRHDTLGYWLWLKHLAPGIRAAAGWAGGDDWQDGSDRWARAFTGHHGQPPLEDPRKLELHFGEDDRSCAMSLARWAFDTFIDDELRDTLDRVDSDEFDARARRCSLWAAGVAVLADWIGSDTEHFRYVGGEVRDLDSYWADSEERATHALAACGVLPIDAPAELGFHEIFPRIETPSPLQQWAIESPVGVQPAIVLLEDVTGAGKTEAAMMLAHRWMAVGASEGFYVGLPSMATANAMYSRIAEMFGRIFPAQASLSLAHGSKELVEAFARTVLPVGGEHSDPAQLDDSASARCAAWLADHNKRALLAQAGVGTIDQALLAALQSKHQSLRLIGLFGKTLVVDEVHACDAYMQRTLESLLTLHARAGGSAVLLSATLPRRMKLALLSAYAAGRGSQVAPLASSDYPLATSWHADRDAAIELPIGTRPDVERRVDVHLVHDEADVINLIVEAVRRGQCVAWIRNTVADLLVAHRLLSGRIPDDTVTVFHARFTLGDRLSIEERVLSRFGPASGPRERRGQVLLANQVAEQSLDVCADVLVTDLAPMDRVLQRAGRLHRHPRDRDGSRLPPGRADERGVPQLWILAPPITEAPSARWYSDLFPKAAYVYPDHGQLWLTMNELRRGHYCMPQDARMLIEAVFGNEAASPEGLQRSSDQAAGQFYSDRSVAQANSISLATGYLRQGVDWLSERSAPSRLGEDTHEIVLARCCETDLDSCRVEPWWSGRPHAWEYSTVRLAVRLIREAVPTDDARLAEAIDAARARMPGGGRHAVLLLLRQDGEGWWADALSGRGQRQRWRYSPSLGLLMMTPDAEVNGLPANAAQL